MEIQAREAFMNLTRAPDSPTYSSLKRDKGFSLSSIQAGARVVSVPERYHRGIASFAIGRLENLNNTKNKELYYREISSSSFLLSPPAAASLSSSLLPRSSALWPRRTVFHRRFEARG